MEEGTHTGSRVSQQVLLGPCSAVSLPGVDSGLEQSPTSGHLLSPVLPQVSYLCSSN